MMMRMKGERYIGLVLCVVYNTPLQCMRPGDFGVIQKALLPFKNALKSLLASRQFASCELGTLLASINTVYLKLPLWCSELHY